MRHTSKLGKFAAKPRFRAPAAKASASREAYHHGDLRQALIDAAWELVAEEGPDAVSMREAARRAGVSPGAPFRHFESRAALMAAVAAEALQRFRAEIERALSEVTADDPRERLRAIALAYLRWAVRNTRHFQIISNPVLFRFEDAADLKAENDSLIAMTEAVIAEAAQRDLLRSQDLAIVQIAGRALVYGLARMLVDGHLPRWGVDEADAERMFEGVIDFYITSIANNQKS